MEPEIAVAVLLVATLLAGIMVLTATGQRRRGQRLAVAFLAGLFFPITWTAWYLRDEHPYRSARGTRSSRQADSALTAACPDVD